MLIKRTYSESKWSSCRSKCMFLMSRLCQIYSLWKDTSCVVIKVQLLHSCLGKSMMVGIWLYVIRLTCCAEDGKCLVASFADIATQTVDFIWRSLELQLISRSITESEHWCVPITGGKAKGVCSLVGTFSWFIDACTNCSELYSETISNQKGILKCNTQSKGTLQKVQDLSSYLENAESRIEILEEMMNLNHSFYSSGGVSTR